MPWPTCRVQIKKQNRTPDFAGEMITSILCTVLSGGRLSRSLALCKALPMSNNVIVWDIETIPDLRGYAVANGHELRRDNQGERAASIRMRMFRWVNDGRRA